MWGRALGHKAGHLLEELKPEAGSIGVGTSNYLAMGQICAYVKCVLCVEI